MQVSEYVRKYGLYVKLTGRTRISGMTMKMNMNSTINMNLIMTMTMNRNVHDDRFVGRKAPCL